MSDSNEGKEILSIYSSFCVFDDFFCQQQDLMAEDLLPVFEALRHKCEGIITASGVYVFQLQILKVE